MNARIYFNILVFQAVATATGQLTDLKTYYPSGELKESYQIMNSDSNAIQGPYQMFDLAGNVIVEGIFQDGN